MTRTEIINNLEGVSRENLNSFDRSVLHNARMYIQNDANFIIESSDDENKNETIAFMQKEINELKEEKEFLMQTLNAMIRLINNQK